MSFKKHILIISVYTLITTVFTWPLAINLNKATPSIIPFYPQYKNMTDEYSEIWVTWRLKKAISQRENFFFLKDIFYPIGANFLIADHSLAESFMVLPILIVSNNPIIAYNFIIILSFVLSAYGVFLLSYHFTKSKEASFIAGLIFSFSSAKIVHILAAHISIFSLQWIPLFLLFFIKIFKEDRLSNYIWASIFLLLTTLTSYYLLVFLVLFAIIWVILNIRVNPVRELRSFTPLDSNDHRLTPQEIKRRRYLTATESNPSLTGLKSVAFSNGVNKNNLLKLGKFSLCAGLLHIPFIMALIQAVIQGYFPKGKGNFEMAYFYGADLLGFFVPGFFHSFFKNIVSGFYKNLSGNAWEHTTYIGYTVLFLFLFSLYKFRRIKEVRNFTVISFFFFILSLGAVFWIGGRPLIVGHKFIYFPQYLFKFIPILNNIRLPSRFFFMMSLSLTIVCGYGIKFILEKFKTKKIILTSVFSFLILIENLSLPFPLNKNLDIPLVYKEISEERGNFAILDIPFSVASGVRALGSYWTIFQFCQVKHQKNILGGNLGRIPDFIYNYYRKMPFVSSLIRLQERKTITQERKIRDKKYLKKTLGFLDLRYVIIHKNLVRNPAIYEYIEEILNPQVEEVTKTKKLIVYKLKGIEKATSNYINFSKRKSSLYILKGFRLYSANPKIVWADSKRATLIVPLKRKKDCLFKVTFFSLKPQGIKMVVNREKIKVNLSKGINSKEFIINKKYIDKGINYIEFLSSEKNWGLKNLSYAEYSSLSR